MGPNNETGLCTADKGSWPGAEGYPDGGPGASPQHVCRYNYNGTISDRDLVEYYLPAWHAVFTRGQAHGMMCSYNAVNGVPSCANHWAMTELARKQWGFDGYVVCVCARAVVPALGARFSAPLLPPLFLTFSLSLLTTLTAAPAGPTASRCR